jgi:hypothetical protein
VLTQFPGLPAFDWPVPPDWPALVTNQEPATALAFCLGNTPQLVRNLQPLLSGALTPPRPVSSRATEVPAAGEWAAGVRDYPLALLGAAVFRLGGTFDHAAELLRREAPPHWQAVRANEEAALAWHGGRSDEAVALWARQDATVPVLFNRGMAALTLGDPTAARAALNPAVAALPETSPWHHLGRLYLALAARE